MAPAPHKKKLQPKDNAFSGPFPLGERNQLVATLRLRNNRFGGRLPRALWQSQALVLLDVANNTLTGSLPDAIGTYFLIYAWLANNRLTGTLPQALADLPQLTEIDLSLNARVAGTLPNFE